MIHNSMERQAWHDRLKGENTTPNGEIITVRGREMAKTRWIICPFCEDGFYSYQLLDNPLPEGNQPDIWTHGEGARITCGHPTCWEAEQQHQNLKAQKKAKSQTHPAPTGIM